MMKTKEKLVIFIAIPRRQTQNAKVYFQLTRKAV